MINTITLPVRKSLKTIHGRNSVTVVLLIFMTFSLSWFIEAQISRAISDVHTVAYDSIPSVDAAERLISLVQVYDATDADWLSAAALTTLHPCILPDSTNSVGMFTYHDCDSMKFPILREYINTQLYAATRNVTYPGEETAIRHIQTGLEEYFASSEKMKENFTQAFVVTGDAHRILLNQAYADYQESQSILTTKVVTTPLDFPEQGVPSCTLPGTKVTLPASVWTNGSLQTAVRCLAALNSAHLASGFTDSQSFLTLSALLTAVGSLVFLLFLLVGLSRIVFLAKRPFSLYNVCMIAGLFLAFSGCFIGYTTLTSLSGNKGNIHRMVIDDRKSIDAAARIGDYATAANDDESRYLIAVNFGDATAQQQWWQDWLSNKAQVNADLGVAKGNITYHPMEDNAYAGMDTWWTKYIAIDGQIRNAIAVSNPRDPHRVLAAQAISLGISNDAFGQFMSYTDQLAQVNLSDYNRTLSAIQNQLQISMWLIFICLPLAGLFTLSGRLIFAREL